MVEHFPCSHISVNSNHYIVIRIEFVTAINIERAKKKRNNKEPSHQKN